MDILLVNSFHETHVHSFSWGVLSNASYLESKGFDVKILDGCYYFNDKNSFFNELEKRIKQTKIVGFTCFSTDTYEIKQMIDFVKGKDPGIKVIVGGPHAVLLPEQTCEYQNIDFVAYGDGEKTLEQLILKIKNNDTDYSSVFGLLYKVNGKLEKTAPAITNEFYDIDYEFFPQKKIDTYKNYMQILTGRGCSFKCTFCYNAITGQKWFPRDIHEIMELSKFILEMKTFFYLKAEYWIL